MRTQKAIEWACGLLAGTLALSVAHGDCPDPRTILAADRAAMTAVMNATLSALPPAPAGWIIKEGDTPMDPPRALCPENMRNPWYYTYTRDYARLENPAGTDEKMAQASAALQAESAAKQPKLDAIMAKMQKINEQLAAGAQKGDYSVIEPLTAERDKLEAEYHRIAEGGDAVAGVEAAAREQGRDAAFTIQIDFNNQVEYVEEGATLLPTPAGAQTTLQYMPVGKEEDSPVRLVLLGTWHKADTRRWVPTTIPGVRLTAPHDIAVIIRGEPERVASVFAAINFSALAARIGK